MGLLLVILFVGSAACAADAVPETGPSAETTPGSPTHMKQVSIKGAPLSPQVLEKVLTTVNAFIADLKADKHAPGYDLLAPQSKKEASESDWHKLTQQMISKTGERRKSVFGFALRTTELPNAPPGEYIVVRLNSQFDKATLVETVILTKVSDRYLISGYHFQSGDAAQ